MKFRTLVVVLALVCFGLAHAQENPYRSPWDIEVREGYTLTKHVYTDQDIPALVLWKDEFADAKKPIVFLLHGGGMPDVGLGADHVAKELWFLPEYYGVPYTLTDGGVAVVIMDQWWAGERFKPDYLDIVRQNYLGSVIRGYVNTTRSVSSMIDALSSRADLDTTRVGVTGRSGGGIVSLMAAATDDRVRAIASWVGQANLKDVAKTKMPEPMMNQMMHADPELEVLLQDFDPVYRLDKMPPAAVLMINNSNDPSIPFEVVRDFHDRLAPYYLATPALLEFRVMNPAVPTHEMTREDYAAGCAWLIEHLDTTDRSLASAKPE